MATGPGGDMAPLSYGAMRASTADRERAVDVLKAAFAEGRLDQSEYADRVGLVYSSRTYAELADVTADLPVGPLGAVPSVAVSPWPGQPPPSIASAPPTTQIPQATRQMNVMAIAAFIFGLGTYVTGGITAPLAIGLAIAAVMRIRRTGEPGAGLAACAALLAIAQLILFQTYWI